LPRGRHCICILKRIRSTCTVLDLHVALSCTLSRSTRDSYGTYTHTYVRDHLRTHIRTSGTRNRCCRSCLHFLHFVVWICIVRFSFRAIRHCILYVIGIPKHSVPLVARIITEHDDVSPLHPICRCAVRISDRRAGASGGSQRTARRQYQHLCCKR